MAERKYKKLPRRLLGYMPTPLIELARLAKKLGGPRILMKRDDQTGLALGGNKTRKLEFLIADALARNCDTLITGGAAQSNHCRQTAAAAAVCGLNCHLVLGGVPPAMPNGNLLLDHLFGAEIHWSGDQRKGEGIHALAETLLSKGMTPYIVPYGGSNEVGAAAFVEAMRELHLQLETMQLEATHVVFASSSGGTHAGLTVGKEIFSAPYTLIGIDIDKGESGSSSFFGHVLELTNKTAKALGVDRIFQASDFILRSEFTGDGYGVVGDAERSAIRMLAEKEGVLLDPVYTGRAMAGLLHMIRNKEFSSSDVIVFWHTGGTPALFPYAGELLQ